MARPPTMYRDPLDPATVPAHLVNRFGDPAELLALLGNLALAEVDQVAHRRARRGHQVHPARVTFTAWEAVERAMIQVGAPKAMATGMAAWLIDSARHHEAGAPGRIT